MFHDVRMRGFKRRADVDEVVAWLDALPLTPRATTAALDAARGRVLAHDLVSGVDVPAFARAAMDGWALHGEDTFGASATDPLPLTVVGTARPGHPHQGTLARGQAVRIMTGAPVPAGADTVLRAEDGSEEEDILAVRSPCPVGRHVGQPGEDIAAGTRLLAAGRVLRPQDLGVASSVGHDTLTVVDRPRVTVLVTGDEVLAPGHAPEGACIADANGPTLAALVARDGGEATVAYLPDDATTLDRRLREAAGDVLLVTGGSSVGEEDHAPRLLAAAGELAFHGIGLRPAAPTGVGRLGATPVVLLPGNPVSCLCAYDLFAGRIVRRLAGLDPALPYPREAGRLSRKIASVLGRVDYVRVRVTDGAVEPVMSSGASILSSTTEADGFVLVARDHEGYAPGAEVTVYRYDGARS